MGRKPRKKVRGAMSKSRKLKRKINERGKKQVPNAMKDGKITSLASLIYDIKQERRMSSVEKMKNATPQRKWQEILYDSPLEINDKTKAVAKRLGIDLDVSYIVKGKDLMLLPFDKNKKHTYGGLLMDLLFTKQEMATSTFEPKRWTKPPLDLDKCNLIKACYYRRLKDASNFKMRWPSILKSLKQKCYKCALNFSEQSDDSFKIQANTEMIEILCGIEKFMSK